MKDKKDIDAPQPPLSEDATDEQLETVAGGRYRDEHGRYREGEWRGHHYHEGYRGYWQDGIWIVL